MSHAGVYSSVLHYLRAVRAAGTDEAQAVASKMRELRVDDFFAKSGKIRADGQFIHDMYLVEVKAPEDSRRPGLLQNPLNYPWRPSLPTCRCRKLNPVGVAHRIGSRWPGCWVSSN